MTDQPAEEESTEFTGEQHHVSVEEAIRVAAGEPEPAEEELATPVEVTGGTVNPAPYQGEVIEPEADEPAAEKAAAPASTTATSAASTTSVSSSSYSAPSTTSSGGSTTP